MVARRRLDRLGLPDTTLGEETGRYRGRMATTGELDGPSEGLRVRAGTTDDAEAITTVINDVCVAQIGVPWITAAEIRDAFRVPPRVPGLGPVVLVDPSGVVVGYLSFGVNHDPFEVDLFCWVALELAGRGVSAWFLRFAERRALAAGAFDECGAVAGSRQPCLLRRLPRHDPAAFTEVELAVDSESETGAPALYERAGMRVVYAWEEWTKAIPAGE
jgi:GNAT superfamily N-acetyltransferase